MTNPQYSYIRLPVKFQIRTVWINNCNIGLSTIKQGSGTYQTFPTCMKGKACSILSVQLIPRAAKPCSNF